MKAYIYPDSEIIRAFGFTPEQLERARVRIAPPFEPTENAGEADFFWVGVDIGHVEAYHGGANEVARGMMRLLWWIGNANRHVFYFCSDGPEPIGLPAIMFRQSFYKNRRDKNTIAWPYAVEDFGNLVTGDFDSLPYDVSFVGSKMSHKSRIESFDSMKDTPELRSFLDDSKMHWGSIEHTEVGRQRKALFVESLAKSKLVLAARGGGLSCYRFFEAMSAGRIPVLLADDWELPHRNFVNWDQCIIQIPEKDAKNAGPILCDYLSKMSNRQLAAMGQYARLVWCNYLAPDVWPEMMAWWIERLLI